MRKPAEVEQKLNLDDQKEEERYCFCRAIYLAAPEDELTRIVITAHRNFKICKLFAILRN